MHVRQHLWCRGSKPIACCFLDIALQAKIGNRGLRVCNYSNQQFACELDIICKAVNRFWCHLVYLIQNMAHYCPAKLLNIINSWLPSALMMRIFSTFLFDFLTCNDYPNQIGITSVRKRYLDSVKGILKQMN